MPRLIHQSWPTKLFNRLAIANLINLAKKYPQFSTAPNFVVLHFETPDSYKFNAEYIKPGGYSNHQMAEAYEDLLKELLQADIGVRNEQKIINLFKKFRRSL